MADHIPQGVPHERDGHLRVTYNDIHILIGNAAQKIREEFDPDLMVAIGGGGFIPARIAVSSYERVTEPATSVRSVS